MATWSGSGEDSSWLADSAVSVYPHMTERERGRGRARTGRGRKLSVASSYKSTNLVMGPTLMTSSKPNHLLKAPPPNTVSLGIGASTYELVAGGQYNPLANGDTTFSGYRLTLGGC